MQSEIWFISSVAAQKVVWGETKNFLLPFFPWIIIVMELHLKRHKSTLTAGKSQKHLQKGKILEIFSCETTFSTFKLFLPAILISRLHSHWLVVLVLDRVDFTRFLSFSLWRDWMQKIARQGKRRKESRGKSDEQIFEQLSEKPRNYFPN